MIEVYCPKCKREIRVEKAGLYTCRKCRQVMRIEETTNSNRTAVEWAWACRDAIAKKQEFWQEEISWILKEFGLEATKGII